jgi:hypothetical protein
MGLWAKGLRIFNAFCDNAKQSIRQVAHQTGFSKSSVHRLKQAMERRDGYPESWLWETAEGHGWLLRLVVATLYIFGLKRGVGADSISEFFCRLRLESHVGCSPSALRGVMDVPIRVVILCSVYAVPWVSWCDAVERRGTVLVVWIFFTSTIACLGVISTPDRSRSTHFEIVSGNACFGQLSTEMFSFITSSASCSRSRRTSGRNQPSTKDLGGIDESIDLSRDR